MKINLLQGDFDKKEALILVTKLIDVKIKHHENSIAALATEEDIKWREQKIKNHQKSLFEFRQFVENKDKVNFECEIDIN